MEEQDNYNQDGFTEVPAADFVRFVFAYIITAFLLVHFFAIFGVLIAFTFPFMWFFLPNRTICFFCLHQRLTHKDKAYCNLCDRKVDSYYNPPLRSVVLNSIILLIVSNICLLIFLFELSFFFNINIPFVVTGTNTAQIDLVPAQDSESGTNYYDIYITSSNQAINLVQADFRFDPTSIEIKEIVTDQSFGTVFIKKDFYNGLGVINIAGGLPSPGFIGKGLLARVVFVRKQATDVSLELLGSSRVFANDGKGTNLLSPAAYTKIEIGKN